MLRSYAILPTLFGVLALGLPGEAAWADGCFVNEKLLPYYTVECVNGRAQYTPREGPIVVPDPTTPAGQGMPAPPMLQTPTPSGTRCHSETSYAPDGRVTQCTVCQDPSGDTNRTCY
jgi:hypothetical protein